MKGNERSGKKQTFRQEDKTENSYNEFEDDREHDNDSFDSAIEATQRDELLESLSQIFVDKVAPKP